MTDFLLISPDGEVTEREGFPSNVVGCHGSGGQNLWETSRGIGTDRETLRVVACDCGLLFPEEHPENRYAYVIVGAAGYVQRWGGTVALELVAWDNEPIVLREDYVLWVRRMANLARPSIDAGVPLEDLLDQVPTVRPPWRT